MYYGFFGPPNINYIVNYDVRVKRYVTACLNVTFYLNALVNPALYAWMSRDFRTAFQKILRVKPREGAPSSVPGSRSKSTENSQF